MPAPKVSIIVPFHNSKATLTECLEAIRKSNYKNLELICIDDASTDDSAEIVKKFNSKTIQLKQNKGAAAARNIGVKASKGEIIVFIDSDVVIKSDSISKAVEKLSKNKDISGVAGFYFLFNRFGNFLSQYKHFMSYYRERECRDINQDSFKTYFLALRKEVFADELFDESFKSASIEDTEFGRKLISKGHNFFRDKTNCVEHIKQFTLKDFLKNQFNRAKDIAKSLLKKRHYAQHIKTENDYAKNYFLTVPVSWLFISALLAFVVSSNYLFLVLALLILLVSLVLEKGFLKFCYSKKGALFTLKCIAIYFVNGFVSGLGILKGLTDGIRERSK